MMYEIKNPAHLVHKEREREKKKAVLGGSSSIVYGSFSGLAVKRPLMKIQGKGFLSVFFNCLNLAPFP